MNNLQTKYDHILEVYAREWFDKINGNSYFSAKMYLDDELISTMPFQYDYGYGSHFQDIALDELKKLGKFEINGGALWSFCDNNRIKLVASKDENCLKRNVVAYGNE